MVSDDLRRQAKEKLEMLQAIRDGRDPKTRRKMIFIQRPKPGPRKK